MFNLRRAAGAPAPAGDPKPGASPGAWLQSHRYTVLAGGGIGVVLLALYKRHAAQAAGNASATGDPTAGGAAGAAQYADTTSVDIYNALEPLIERMSGFDGTSQLLQQDQNILDAIGKLPGPTVTPAPAPAPAPKPSPSPSPATTDQFHRVLSVGRTGSLSAYIKQLWPSATPQQVAQEAQAVINDPRNRGVQHGDVLLGGSALWFPHIPVQK